MQRTPLALAAACLLVLAGAASSPAPAQSAAAEALAPCSSCHEDVANAFHANPHRAAGKGALNACQSCHGEGSAHAESGDPSLIAVPRGDAGAATCASCHSGSAANPISVRGSHGRAGVQCDSCHQIHVAPAPHALLKAQGSTACVACHTEQRAQFQRPFGHRMDLRETAGMTCYDCHNPHASPQKGSLKRTHAGERACLGCHTEMRGPFVFPHVTSVAGDCESCHQPHGSTNPRSLTRNDITRLCLECHSPVSGGTVGSQPPSFHDLRSPRYAECTTCHVAVHGSNSSPGLLR